MKSTTESPQNDPVMHDDDYDDDDGDDNDNGDADDDDYDDENDDDALYIDFFKRVLVRGDFRRYASYRLRREEGIV